MKKFVTIAILAIASSSLAACTAEPQEAASSSSEARIIGGNTDWAHPSVGMLRTVTQVDPNGQPAASSTCTATLVAPSIMITAAHCAVGGLWSDVTFEATPNIWAPFGSPGWVNGSVIANPQYDGDPSHGHDIAVVALAGQPWVPPVPLAGAPPVGSVVTAVGYGMNVFASDGTGSGVRRAVNLPLLAVIDREMVAGLEGQSTCHGDSGGPLFANGALVGTTSYGDSAECHGSAHYMRIDDNLDFLHRFGL